MQQLYHSTRSKDEFVTTKQAIVDGIAKDGGLYVLDNIENDPINLDVISSNDFYRNANAALSRLLVGFESQWLKRSIHEAYKTFSTRRVCPVTPFGDDFLLELYHGPTCAFKDVALQMLPMLLSEANSESNTTIHILTATSGDTGKAALDGFANVEGVGITVFYPKDGVSDIQKLQMQTQTGNNVRVCAIRGNFDDAQTEVKRIFTDEDLRSKLALENVHLSSANSINIGRLAPQVSYYLDAYAQLVQVQELTLGENLDFVVPTGNFGDILAGYLAKKMGLPISKLIVASNANNVLTDFFTTGKYDRCRHFYKTISPSMDILVSSNLERLLYYVSDGDVELIAHLMDELEHKGTYTVPASLLSKLQESFGAAYASDDETRASIKSSWENLGKLIDPHTAVAARVAEKFEVYGAKRVILSTANPYKFAKDVLSAIRPSSMKLARDGFKAIDLLYGSTGVSVPNALAKLRIKEILHTQEIAPAEMSDYVVEQSKDMFEAHE